MKTRRRKSRSAGLSLLECLAAMVILGTAIVAGLQLTALQTNVGLHAQDVDAAVRLLCTEMEHVRLTPYDSLRTDAEYVEWSQEPDYYYQWIVTEDAVDWQKTVTVNVKYVNQAGDSKILSMTTLRCNLKGVEGGAGMTDDDNDKMSNMLNGETVK